MFHLICPHCGHRIPVKFVRSGAKATCMTCKQVFEVSDRTVGLGQPLANGDAGVAEPMDELTTAPDHAGAPPLETSRVVHRTGARQHRQAVIVGVITVLAVGGIVAIAVIMTMRLNESANVEATGPAPPTGAGATVIVLEPAPSPGWRAIDPPAAPIAPIVDASADALQVFGPQLMQADASLHMTVSGARQVLFESVELRAQLLNDQNQAYAELTVSALAFWPPDGMAVNVPVPATFMPAADQFDGEGAFGQVVHQLRMGRALPDRLPLVQGRFDVLITNPGARPPRVRCFLVNRFDAKLQDPHILVEAFSGARQRLGAWQGWAEAVIEPKGRFAFEATLPIVDGVPVSELRINVRGHATRIAPATEPATQPSVVPAEPSDASPAGPTEKPEP